MVIDMSRIACLMKQCEPHGVEGSGEIAPMMAFAISALLAVPAAAQSADRFKQPLGLTRRRSSTNYRRDEASATNARRRGAHKLMAVCLMLPRKTPKS